MMVPLDKPATRYVRTWLGPLLGPGLLALRHALLFPMPGLWGDDPVQPQSVILVRDGDDQREAFGAGEPEPAVGWLIDQHKAFTLHAPDDWLEAVRARLGGVEKDSVETWTEDGSSMSLRRSKGSSARSSAAPTLKPAPPRVVTRRLTLRDFAWFTRLAPTWGLRSWRTYPLLMDHGAAFGVPHQRGFAALAWVLDQADAYDAVAVFTEPRFRRLGLGRAAASALIEHIVRRRGKIPLWSTLPDNEASRFLARSLGLSVAATEHLVRWAGIAPPGRSA
jgi:GNAT superfamily N-acetyltransferase